MDLFASLEEMGKLSLSDENDLALLHSIFASFVLEDVERWVNYWNYHRLCSKKVIRNKPGIPAVEFESPSAYFHPCPNIEQLAEQYLHLGEANWTPFVVNQDLKRKVLSLLEWHRFGPLNRQSMKNAYLLCYDFKNHLFQ